MSNEEHQATVRRAYDTTFNQKDPAAARDCYSVDYVDHMPHHPEPMGIDNKVEAEGDDIIVALTDVTVTFADAFGAGDRLVVRRRITGLPRREWMGRDHRFALFSIAVPLGITVLAGIAACGPVPPSPPPTTTGVSASVTTPAQGASTCTGDLRWQYQIVSAEPGTGRTDTVTHDVPYNAPSSSDKCTYSDGQLGMHPGVWKITVLGQTCTVDLAPIVGDHNLAMESCTVV